MVICILYKSLGLVCLAFPQVFHAAASNRRVGIRKYLISEFLKTIESADRILFIHHGELIESGTHEELLEMKGFYHELYESQFTI
ncbi:hypothetical protein [Sporosarcina sp. FA9]|uniref:hypothetical protein n=1 Tax=Sporosarcina sp. FA9 TaxID=3413030 RepID=UPI003F65E155